MKEDSELTNRKLRVDGGMTSNNLLMQLQADLSGIEVGLYKTSILYNSNLKRYLLVFPISHLLFTPFFFPISFY